MRLLALLLAVPATACFAEVDDFRFGPLSGQWDGVIVYQGDSYEWSVSIEQAHYREGGGPFQGHQTVTMNSAHIGGPVTGTYYHPDVSMDFSIALEPAPLICGYLGRASDDHDNMTGRLSCRQADTVVVSHDMTLAKVGY